MTILNPEKFSLVRPAEAHIASYSAALRRGWSPDHLRGAGAIEEHLLDIRQNLKSFLADLDDPDGNGRPIILPNGCLAERLPSITRWMWCGEFIGSISLRWTKDGSPLPGHVLGNIGFTVVPWHRGNGFAKRALSLILDHAWALGLDHVTLTTKPDNLASQAVIASGGGKLMGLARLAAPYEGERRLMFRINRDEDLS